MSPDPALVQRLTKLVSRRARRSRLDANSELDKLIAGLDPYAKDLLIACPGHNCKALPGKPCKGYTVKIVHIGRRIARLLAGIR